MVKKDFFITAIGLVLLIGMQACVSEEIIPFDRLSSEGIKAVSFSSKIGNTVTRTTDNGSQWENGDTIGIYMFFTDATDITNRNVAANRSYVEQDVNAFKPSSIEQTIFYPGSGTFRYMAYYPFKHVGAAQGSIVNGNFPVDVSNQSDTTHIDVLYSGNINDDVMGDAHTVLLQFEHVLSKIVINVKGAAGTDVVINGMTALINGMPAKANLNLFEGTLENIGANTTIPIIGVGKKNQDFDTTFQAIIIPHTFSSGNDIIQFLSVRRQYTWDIAKSISETEFLPSKLYTFNLTLNGEMPVEFTAEIADWTDWYKDSGSEFKDDTGHDVNGVKSRKIIAGGTDTIDVAYIAGGGDFMMGTTGEANAQEHRVHLTAGYLIGQNPITNAQYAKFLNTQPGITVASSVASMDISVFGSDLPTGSTNLITGTSGTPNWGLNYASSKWAAPTGYENNPVVNLTWYGAMAYARWAGGDLPTEAQWEYAARAGVNNTYLYINKTSDGSANGDGNTLANYAWYSSKSTTNPVGKLMANAWNLYDVYGNVWEICKDLLATSTPEAYSINGDLTVDPLTRSGNYPAVRGGGYANTIGTNMQLGHRSTLGSLTTPAVSTGFRIIFPLKQ